MRLLLFTLITCLFHLGYGQESDSKEKTDNNAKIKAVFIYNFTKYIEWPEEVKEGDFKIGVYNNPDLLAELETTAQVKKIGRRKMEIIPIKELNQVNDLHILYVGDFNQFGMDEIYLQIGNKPTLLVTSKANNPGSMINFIVIGKRQKFELNKTECKKQNLSVNPTLANLAINVKTSFSYPRTSSKKEPERIEPAILKINKDKLSTLSDEEFDKAFIKMQKDLVLEREVSAKKDKEINALKSEITGLEAQVILKETELKIVQEEISLQEKKLLDLEGSIGLQQQEYIDNKKLAEESKKDLQRSVKKLEKMKVELQNINHLLDNQRLISYSIFFILLIIASLGFLAFNNYRKQKKQAAIISKQKTLAEIQRDEITTQHLELEEKNREITDSINYAKRIQEAILPPLKLVQQNLKDSFILYLPKDIVAGDFYWMQNSNDKIIFAAADCTGHGVPGALVSVVCSNALNRAVREFDLSKPSKILDKTLEIVIERFEKSEEEVKDGMDIALCSYNPSTLKLEYAGAHNPLWLIKKGADEVTEIKGNKQPIGKYANTVPFNNHEIQLEKGDTIYLFSDGYVDQFGGERGKKLKSVNFKRLLLSIQEQSIDQQYDSVKNHFNSWKKDLEQLDDVCVIAFKA